MWPTKPPFISSLHQEDGLTFNETAYLEQFPPALNTSRSLLLSLDSVELLLASMWRARYMENLWPRVYPFLHLEEFKWLVGLTTTGDVHVVPSKYESGANTALTLAISLAYIIAAIAGFGMMTTFVYFGMKKLVELNALSKSIEKIDS